MTYRLFNILCIIVSAGFLLGTFFVFQKMPVSASSPLYESPVDVVYVEPIEVGEEIPNIPVEEESVSSSIVETSTDVTKDEEPSFTVPEQMNLAVPFTSQAPEKNWDQPWQDACEEAAVLMLDAYYKKYELSPLFARDEILSMVQWQTSTGWGYSISMNQIEQQVHRYIGKTNTKIIEDPTIDDIKTSVAKGHPVYVVAAGKELDNPHFSGEGPEYHALIIRGYTPTHFITNDPGTQHGENFQYTYQNLLQSIHDWNNGDVENGRKVVLVFE